MPKYPDFVWSSDGDQVTPVAVVGKPSQLVLTSEYCLAYFPLKRLSVNSVGQFNVSKQTRLLDKLTMLITNNPN